MENDVDEALANDSLINVSVDYKSMREVLTELTIRLERAGIQITELEQHKEVTQLNERIDRMQVQLDKCVLSLNEPVEAPTSSMDAVAEGLEKQISEIRNTLPQKLDDTKNLILEDVDQKLKEALNDMKNDIENNGKDCYATISMFNALNARIEDVERFIQNPKKYDPAKSLSRQGSTKERTGLSSSAANDLKEQVMLIQNSVDFLKNRVNEIGQNASQLQENVDGITGTVGELGGKVEVLEKNREAVQELMKQLRESFENRIKELENKQAQEPGEPSADPQEITKNVSQAILDQLLPEITKLQHKNKKLSEKIKAQEEKIKELEDRPVAEIREKSPVKAKTPNSQNDILTSPFETRQQTPQATQTPETDVAQEEEEIIDDSPRFSSKRTPPIPTTPVECSPRGHASFKELDEGLNNANQKIAQLETAIADTNSRIDNIHFPSPPKTPASIPSVHDTKPQTPLSTVEGEQYVDPNTELLQEHSNEIAKINETLNGLDRRVYQLEIASPIRQLSPSAGAQTIKSTLSTLSLNQTPISSRAETPGISGEPTDVPIEKQAIPESPKTYKDRPQQINDGPIPEKDEAPEDEESKEYIKEAFQSEIIGSKGAIQYAIIATQTLHNDDDEDDEQNGIPVTQATEPTYEDDHKGEAPPPAPTPEDLENSNLQSDQIESEPEPDAPKIQMELRISTPINEDISPKIKSQNSSRPQSSMSRARTPINNQIIEDLQKTQTELTNQIDNLHQLIRDMGDKQMESARIIHEYSQNPPQELMNAIDNMRADFEYKFSNFQPKNSIDLSGYAPLPIVKKIATNFQVSIDEVDKQIINIKDFLKNLVSKNDLQAMIDQLNTAPPDKDNGETAAGRMGMSCLLCGKPVTSVTGMITESDMARLLGTPPQCGVGGGRMRGSSDKYVLVYGKDTYRNTKKRKSQNASLPPMNPPVSLNMQNQSP